MGSAAAMAGEPALGPVVAWTFFATTVLIWAWRTMWPQDAAGTEALAEREGRLRTSDTAVLIACLISLAVVVLALVRSAGQKDLAGTLTVLLSIVSVVLSWGLVNTVFALKYARHFYVDRDGGFDFDVQTPAYSDFAYIAFTIGMTFAVAETAPQGSAARKLVLGHALLSYLFGTGILAVGVNLVTNLAQ